MKIIIVTLTSLIGKSKKGIRTSSLKRVTEFIKPYEKAILDNEVKIQVKTKKIN